MSDIDKHQKKVLLALVQEHRESRKPVRALIIKAAMNARDKVKREQIDLALEYLYQHELISKHGHDGWAPTGKGMKVAAGSLEGPVAAPARKTGSAPKHEPEPAPAVKVLTKSKPKASRPVTVVLAECIKRLSDMVADYRITGMGEFTDLAILLRPAGFETEKLGGLSSADMFFAVIDAIRQLPNNASRKGALGIIDDDLMACEERLGEFYEASRRIVAGERTSMEVGPVVIEAGDMQGLIPEPTSDSEPESPEEVNQPTPKEVLRHTVGSEPEVVEIGKATEEPTGRKDDGGELRMDLLFTDMPNALAEVVEVLTLDAVQHAPGDWQHAPDPARRYQAESLRHELALARGEDLDAETRRHHLAHSICSQLYRLELALRASGEGQEAEVSA
ncbi:dATP/dGTP diphosphohydrolase domain-containing protein [Halomonas caseinilytica]|uniref:dATP/dGTP diphosphohydrolase N-terminal domain-containing protein n=1 Tax=Halomonas caseinilytica TaxID=438744 RepID=A0A1M6T7X1_9GAMM|nr:dATP/dGTP diphosphohydrolase domain-containing protein [Halomonas caseinilytica]SHK53053.1 hypothetical protein SAMN05192556_103245 [Halomonas caseinilytica]